MLGAWSSLIRDSRHRKAATCQKSTQTAYHTLRITPITCLKLCTTPTAFKVSQNGKIPARIRRLRIIWFWRACYQVLLHWNCLQNAQLLQHCHLFLRWHLTKCMISYKAAQGNIFQNAQQKKRKESKTQDHSDLLRGFWKCLKKSNIWLIWPSQLSKFSFQK